MYLDIILEIKYHILNTYHINIGNDACLLIRKYCYNYLPINLKNELFEFIFLNKFKILPQLYRFTMMKNLLFLAQIKNFYSRYDDKRLIEFGFNPSGFFKHYN